jgi:predicted nucleic acid-binding protein
VIPSLILDCSITMAWCFSDESTPETTAVQTRLANEAAVVPAHWFLEVSNVLALAEKKQRIAQPDVETFANLLDLLDIQVDHEAHSRAFAHLIPLCRVHKLTSYDAAYLDLAMRLKLPLATLDDELRMAAMTLGLTVIGK